MKGSIPFALLVIFANSVFGIENRTLQSILRDENPSILTLIEEKSDKTYVVAGEGLQSAVDCEGFIETSDFKDETYEVQSPEGWIEVDTTLPATFSWITDREWENFQISQYTRGGMNNSYIKFPFSVRDQRSLWKISNDLVICFNCKHGFINIWHSNPRRTIPETSANASIEIYQDAKWKSYIMEIAPNSLQISDRNGLIFKEDIDLPDLQLTGSFKYLISSYFETTKSSKVIFISLSQPLGFDQICLAITYRMCESCSMKLSIGSEGEEIKSETIIHEDIDWREYKFVAEVKSKNPTTNLNFYIETIKNEDSKDVFWAVKALRRCKDKKELRIFKSSGRVSNSSSCSLLRYPEANQDQNFLNHRIRKELKLLQSQVVDDFTVDVMFECDDEAVGYAYVSTEGVDLTKLLQIRSCSRKDYVCCSNITGLSANTTYKIRVGVFVLDVLYYESKTFEVTTTNLSLLALQNVNYEWTNDILTLMWDKPKLTVEKINYYTIIIKESFKQTYVRTERLRVNQITSIDGKYSYKFYNLPDAEWYNVSVIVNDNLRNTTINVISSKVKRPMLDGKLQIGSCTLPVCLLEVPSIKNLQPRHEIFIIATNLSSERIYNYTNSNLVDIFKQIGSITLTNERWLVESRVSTGSFVTPIGNDTKRLIKDNSYEVSLVIVNKYEFWTDYKVYKTVIDFSKSNLTPIIAGAVVLILLIVIAIVIGIYFYKKKSVIDIKNLASSKTEASAKVRMSVQNNYNTGPPDVSYTNKRLPMIPGERSSQETDHLYAELPSALNEASNYSYVYEGQPKHPINTVPQRKNGSYITDEVIELQTKPKRVKELNQQAADTYIDMTPQYANKDERDVTSEQYMDMNKLTKENTQCYADMTGNRRRRGPDTDEDGYLKVK